ncbi:uncharacterized protein LOC126370875 [Pectinophora gossypiella]|nr:uncharacterized protein LOC126370875 [Pectinophora gossypiella]
MKPYLMHVCTAVAFCGILSVALAAPSVIMGTETGELLRCKFKNASDCKTVNQQTSGVSALTVEGEFVYIGLESGLLRRCRITKLENCTTFHDFTTQIYDLAISGMFVYAAIDGGITRCGLRKSDDCSSFYESETPIYSLAIHSDKLYAGSSTTTIQCPLLGTDNCTVYFSTTSAVNAMSAFSEHLYIGLEEGGVQQCQLNNGTECSKLLESETPVKALDIFDNQIHISLDKGEMLHYDLTKNESCTVSKNMSVVSSMFTIFSSTGVKVHYRGESKDCVWQWISCPPYVVYYDIEARSPLELHVKNGKLYTSKGDLFDTDQADFSHSGQKAIFVMDPSGRIYASNQHPILLLHHSSLMAGNPVAAAGELKVDEGVIRSVSSCSGHYRPTLALTKQIITSLRRQGYNKDVNIQNCFGLDLYIDLDYKKTDLYYKAQYEKYSRKMKSLNKTIV